MTAARFDPSQLRIVAGQASLAEFQAIVAALQHGRLRSGPPGVTRVAPTAVDPVHSVWTVARPALPQWPDRDLLVGSEPPWSAVVA